MKKHKTLIFGKTVHFILLAIITLIIAASCVSTNKRIVKTTNQIFLYGEVHGVERIKNRQLEIWSEFYHNQNMRHMFIESAYFTAEFLNIWIQSDNDGILDELFNDWTGTLAHNPFTLMFYQKIKSEFPGTIFHGIDVGHNFGSTGKRFLQYLQDNKMQDTELYLMTIEAIKQGENFYRDNDPEYRETTMAKNFISTFNRLGGLNIMGIFGTTHARFGIIEEEGKKFPTMAECLKTHYGDFIHTENLSWYGLKPNSIPIRVDIIKVNDVEYKASYFGTRLFPFGDFETLNFWRLENAYDDFKDKPTNEDWLPYEDYPMIIEINQIFIMDIIMTDGTAIRLFYRSDGEYWCGQPITTGFSID